MQTYKLGEIFYLKQGNHLPVSDLLEEGFSVFGANGKIGYYDRYMYEEPMVLVSCRGANCGSINLTESKSWVTGNSIALVPNGKEDIDTNFLYYILKGSDFKNVISGSAQPQIIVGNLTNKTITLPSLATQRTIATKLDKLQSLIDLKKQAIAKTDELAKSIFLEMFGDPMTNEKGWENGMLGDINNITSSKRIFENEYVNFGVPFYRTKEIVELNKGKNISLELYISEERYNQIKSESDIPRIGDILISAVGTIGITRIVNHNNPFYFKDGNLLRIKKSDKINEKYLSFYLEMILLSNKESIVSGSGYNALTIQNLKKLHIPLPPLQLQKKFADIITELESTKEKNKQALARLEDLYQSEMQRSFSL